MDKFAFLVHPLGLWHFYQTLGRFNFIAQKIPAYITKNMLKNIPPYKFAHLKNIVSINGDTIEGFAIMCPLLPDQMVTLKDSIAKDKIFYAVKLAKRLGARVIGLGGFTSIVTDGGNSLTDVVDIAVTSGNTYTSVLAIDGLLRVDAELIKINPKQSTLSIIGATGDIGSICSKVLSGYVSTLILVARDRDKLNLLKEDIGKENNLVRIIISNDIRESVKSADMVLAATSAVVPIINTDDLKRNAILCDVSYPPNIDQGAVCNRKDILAFDGGLAKSSCFNRVSKRLLKTINLFNSRGTIHGCLAETMLLTFEKKFYNFSLGRGNISVEKISEMRMIGAKHGFDVAPFICGDRLILDSEITALGKK